MKTIAIVYFSGTGHTARLAEAVHRGAGSVPETISLLLPIEPADIVGGRFNNQEIFARLATADAIVFGSPTYMGGPAAQVKAFIDATGGIWYTRGWKDKLAAAFTYSGEQAGDKLSTLQYFAVAAAQHGMIWVGNSEIPSQDTGVNRTAAYLGAIGHGNSGEGQSPQIHKGDALTGEFLGRRVAEVAHRFATAAAPAAA